MIKQHRINFQCKLLHAQLMNRAISDFNLKCWLFASCCMIVSLIALFLARSDDFLVILPALAGQALGLAIWVVTMNWHREIQRGYASAFTRQHRLTLERYMNDPDRIWESIAHAIELENCPGFQDVYVVRRRLPAWWRKSTDARVRSVVAWYARDVARGTYAP